MHRVAESLVKSEIALGIDSVMVNLHEQTQFENILDSDIVVAHTHFPDEVGKRMTKPYKLVWVGHGTPEHVFQSSVEEGANHKYGHGDGWMLFQHWMQTADALVTFWPRHQAIIKSLCDKATKVHCFPLGLDKTFWCPQPTRGKFSGTPSLYSSENCHYIKWPLDLFIMWPWVYPRVKGNPVLHCPYLPNDQHRWFFPLVNRNGCSYASHISPIAFSHEDLRNAMCSVDFFIGLVRYGDYNRLSLEANACGTAKTISYRGNPYSDYWLTEGSQLDMAEDLIRIMNGEVEPRKDKEAVPDIQSTAQSMKEVYESILD